MTAVNGAHGGYKLVEEGPDQFRVERVKHKQYAQFTRRGEWIEVQSPDTTFRV